MRPSKHRVAGCAVNLRAPASSSYILCGYSIRRNAWGLNGKWHEPLIHAIKAVINGDNEATGLLTYMHLR